MNLLPTVERINWLHLFLLVTGTPLMDTIRSFTRKLSAAKASGRTELTNTCLLLCTMPMPSDLSNLVGIVFC